MITFTEAGIRLAAGRDKTSRPVACATHLIRLSNNEIGVRYHETDVVKIRKDGSYVLDSGSWFTKCTKQRIEEFSPARIVSVDGVWTIGDSLFEDGIRVSRKGCPIMAHRGKALEHFLKEKRQLDKVVRKYITAFVQETQHPDFPEPGNGDCFYCSMATAEGLTLGDTGRDFDHLFSHFEENYFVPSLLLNALKEGAARGIRPGPWQGRGTKTSIQDVVSRHWWAITRSHFAWLAETSLRRYFSTRKYHMIRTKVGWENSREPLPCVKALACIVKEHSV